MFIKRLASFTLLAYPVLELRQRHQQELQPRTLIVTHQHNTSKNTFHWKDSHTPEARMRPTYHKASRQFFYYQKLEQ